MVLSSLSTVPCIDLAFLNLTFFQSVPSPCFSIPNDLCFLGFRPRNCLLLSPEVSKLSISIFNTLLFPEISVLEGNVLIFQDLFHEEKELFFD